MAPARFMKCSRQTPFAASVKTVCGVCAWKQLIFIRSIGQLTTLQNSKRDGQRWPSSREKGGRWIGVSNFSVEEMKRAQAIAPITSLQPPYSLIRREIEEEILPFCQRQGIGVIVYSPMASGLLTGAMTLERIAKLPDDDWRKRDPSFREPKLSEHLGACRTASCSRCGAWPFAWRSRHRADARSSGCDRRDRRRPQCEAGGRCHDRRYDADRYPGEGGNRSVERSGCLTKRR